MTEEQEVAREAGAFEVAEYVARELWYEGDNLVSDIARYSGTGILPLDLRLQHCRGFAAAVFLCFAGDHMGFQIRMIMDAGQVWAPVSIKLAGQAHTPDPHTAYLIKESEDPSAYLEYLSVENYRSDVPNERAVMELKLLKQTKELLDCVNLLIEVWASVAQLTHQQRMMGVISGVLDILDGGMLGLTQKRTLEFRPYGKDFSFDEHQWRISGISSPGNLFITSGAPRSNVTFGNIREYFLNI